MPTGLPRPTAELARSEETRNRGRRLLFLRRSRRGLLTSWARGYFWWMLLSAMATRVSCPANVFLEKLLVESNEVSAVGFKVDHKI